MIRIPLSILVMCAAGATFADQPAKQQEKGLKTVTGTILSHDWNTNTVKFKVKGGESMTFIYLGGGQDPAVSLDGKHTTMNSIGNNLSATVSFVTRGGRNILRSVKARTPKAGPATPRPSTRAVGKKSNP